MRLAGKAVLVTGAQQGIGRAMAREFRALELGKYAEHFRVDHGVIRPKGPDEVRK
jgi:NAD(P)-dependent dehydrogenase (short-subunit alcohol dehydrogenase family)